MVLVEPFGAGTGFFVPQTVLWAIGCDRKTYTLLARQKTMLSKISFLALMLAERAPLKSNASGSGLGHCIAE